MPTWDEILGPDPVTDNNLESVIDRVMGTFDDLCWAGHDAQTWPEIDELLLTFPWRRDPEYQIIVVVLSMVSPIHEGLEHYAYFFDTAEARLGPEAPDEIMGFHRPAPFEWMQTIFFLDEGGHRRKALSFLFDRVEYMVQKGQAEEIDRFLNMFPWGRKPSIQILIGMLTITAFGITLKEYQPFCSRVRDYIVTHHPDRDVDKLLQGFGPPLRDKSRGIPIGTSLPEVH